MSNEAETTVERRAFTLAEAAGSLGIAKFTLQRAISHRLVDVIFIGRKPLVPAREVTRLARDGLPRLPRGYRRQSRPGKRHQRSEQRAST